MMDPSTTDSRRQELELERWTAEPSGRVVVERAITRGALTRVLEAWSLPWRVTSEAIGLVIGLLALAVMTLGQIAMAIIYLTMAIIGIVCWLAFGGALLWVAGLVGGATGVFCGALLFVSATASMVLASLHDEG